MWTIDGEPEAFLDGHGTSGYDGDWYRWHLRAGDQRLFTVVKIPRHVAVAAGDLTERTAAAAASDGRTEVERHLGDAVPPRSVELRTGSREPLITRREPTAA
jgi:hypothetical protein